MPSSGMTVSPAAAPLAAPARLQGASRDVQPVVAVPLGETYQVAARAGSAQKSAAVRGEARTRAFLTVRKRSGTGPRTLPGRASLMRKMFYGSSLDGSD